MRDLNLIVWLSQLGLTVACPLAGFTLVGVWLQRKFDLGIWIILLGVAIGLISAVQGFRASLRIMEKLSRNKKKDNDPPAVSFNDHQ